MWNPVLFVTRQLSTQAVTPRIAIIGSGPSAFYVAQQLIKKNKTTLVDLYERLPVPFGLVRYGVAPDHPEVKNCINQFTKTAKNTNVRFIGNVQFGKDVNMKQLKEAYHAVVLAYGADGDKVFGIPGENLKNVLSARRFVGWYNGLPEDQGLDPQLDCENVAVLGQGNVAIDVARILLKRVDSLKSTDITEKALAKLSTSRVKRVHLIGRRGPLQVAFTIKEFREMVNLPDVSTLFAQEQIKGLSDIIPTLKRPRNRLMQLIADTAVASSVCESIEEAASKNKKEYLFCPVFLRSPVTFLGSDSLTGVKLSVNRLEGTEYEKQIAVETGEYETFNCGLVLRSIGYKSRQVDPDIPFDTKKSRARQEPGVYCAGWLATGPIGVILTTMSDSFQTGDRIAKDLAENVIDVSVTKPGSEAILSHLAKIGVQTTSFSDWERIDKIERERGKKLGKLREKVTVVEEMLRIAFSG